MDKVSNLDIEFLFCLNKKPKIRIKECLQQITMNESDIYIIATLNSLAQTQKPVVTPLDFKELCKVYTKAYCKVYISI